MAKLIMMPIVSAAPMGLWQAGAKILEDDDELPKAPGDPDLWIYLGVAVTLVLLGGVFAGLTIALMGQGTCSLTMDTAACSTDGSR